MLRKLDEIKLPEPLVGRSGLGDYRLPKELKKSLQSQFQSLGYGFDSYTSFAITDNESSDKPANYALIPNQYFVFAGEMYEFANELFGYFSIYEKLRRHASRLLGSHEVIKNNIMADKELFRVFDSVDDIELFSRFLDKYDDSYRLGSKRLINDEGKPRGARDCFGSVILKKINIPDASAAVFGRLVYDLAQNSNAYRSVYDAYQSVRKYTLTSGDVVRSEKTILSKPFLLLAGISGTGKTRFVREQAKVWGRFSDTYCLTSVRPDWHEPSDLLGYISRLNGAAEYVTTDVLQFIAKAWRAIADSNLTIKNDESDRLVVTGQREDLEQVLPYWLCLDEMNLAPVEQYFADYLSVLETREWAWQPDESFTYSCDALLKPATINEVADKNKLREMLGFGSAAEGKYDELWERICQFGLGIPFNLLVAGTVNMDETTHGFSRKVIDRALSFDFGAFFPNDYEHFFEPNTRNKHLSYPTLSHASREDLQHTCDKNGALTIGFLSAVNAVLKNTPFELAYRALNELLLAVASTQPEDDLTLRAVWDDFMMCKVLPRIEGDSDKLTRADGSSLLDELDKVLAVELAEIYKTEPAEQIQRPDLYREKIVEEGATDTETVLRIPCRSKAKLQWMRDRLTSATFTSFWP